MSERESLVVFIHKNSGFVLQNEEIVLNRYHREFGGEREVDFVTKIGDEQV